MGEEGALEGNRAKVGGVWRKEMVRWAGGLEGEEGWKGWRDGTAGGLEAQEGPGGWGGVGQRLRRATGGLRGEGQRLRRDGEGGGTGRWAAPPGADPLACGPPLQELGATARHATQ
eukprot:355594-Chlamydomonas_euryale.AAC.2